MAQLASKQQLISTIAGTPIDNRTRSWNCQHWVGDGLERVAEQRWIDRQTKSNATSDMVDVVMDAQEEED